MTPEELATRAGLAERIVADPFYQESWDEALRLVLEGWENTLWSEGEKREAAWQVVKGLRLAKSVLESVMREGSEAASLALARSLSRVA